jgi:protein O-GlcNAc transferase
VCAKTGDIGGAIMVLRQIIDALPQFAEARYNLGLNLWSRYKHSEGIRQKQDLDDAAAALRAAIQLEPRDPRFHIAFGQLLAETQDLGGAVERLRTAVELAPDAAENAYNLGLALRLKGDLGAAEAQLRTAIRKDPRHALAHRALGLILRQNGDVVEAANELRRSLADRPGDAQGHHILGTILLKLDRTDEAVAELREAIRLDGDLTEARVMLAQTLARQPGGMDEARQQQQEIRRINTRNADGGRTLVLLQTASELLRKGDSATALAHLREAATLSPEFAEAHYQLGIALLPSAPGAAEAAFTRVLNLRPDHAEAHHRLALLLLARHDSAAAAAELAKAVYLAPSLVAARRLLGRLALDSRDWATAVAELQKAVVWDPSFAEAHFDLAAGLNGRGDREEAAKELAIALRLKPELRIPR